MSQKSRCPLDPKLQEIIDAQLAAIPKGMKLTDIHPKVLRQFLAGKDSGTPVPVGNVTNRIIPGPASDLPVRIYKPDGTGPFPVLLYFHGGGFTVGDLSISDPICRSLCTAASVIIFSVDYRLAPENKFPAATDDCLAATRWIGKHAIEIGGDPIRIAVGGDSAGGNLAAVTTLRIRDQGGPPLKGQVMFYPVTDYYENDHLSMMENAEGYLLTRNMVIYFADYYLNNKSEADNPYAFPLRAKDLSGLPPALIITAGYDPLRDEGELYANRLKKAGVPTVLSRYDNMFHGFIGYIGAIAQSQEAIDETSTWLKEAFHQ